MSVQELKRRQTLSRNNNVTAVLAENVTDDDDEESDCSSGFSMETADDDGDVVPIVRDRIFSLEDTPGLDLIHQSMFLPSSQPISQVLPQPNGTATVTTTSTTTGTV